MGRSYWLIKTEPDEYSWETFLSDASGRWDGVRNFAARNNLRKMRVGDWALFYHTGKERRIVGVASVKKEHYPDPTAEKGDFSSVDFAPLAPLSRPVSLQEIKQEPKLRDMALARSPRLSVQPVRSEEFHQVLRMGQTKLESEH
jgi:predicted RNA-binding protein with PUA-like domain